MPFHSAELNSFSFLVTGGSGFIGSHLVEYLLNNNAKRIVVLDDLSTGFLANIKPFLDAPNVEFIEGSIVDPAVCEKACEGIDYVLHQAALGSVPRSIADPIATHQVNSTGFLNMLQAAKANNVKRFVFASSSSVYGDSKALPKEEAVIGTPLSPYAVTKRSNELYAHVFGLNYGLEIIGLRYFNIFGPRQNPAGPYAAAIPIFMDSLLKNEAPTINGDGSQTRDFTYVENAVQGNIRAVFASSEAVGKVFNIATGSRVSVLELYESLRKQIDSPLEPNYGPTRQGDVRDSHASIERAKRLLSYEPTVQFEQGLSNTVEWFRNNYSQALKT